MWRQLHAQYSHPLILDLDFVNAGTHGGSVLSRADSGLRKDRRHDDYDGQPLHLAISFHDFARCSAVRHPSACAVSVGFRAPLVPITEAPRTARFGTSCEKPHRLTTLVSALSPMRVPPYACVVGPIVPIGPFSVA